MADAPIRTLIAVDSGLDARTVERAVPNDAEIQTIGVVEGLDESWRTLQDSSVDVLVIACLGYSDRALTLIDGAVKQDASRPVIVLSQGSPNGFVRRVFDAGADDILVLPGSIDEVRFAITKSVARRAGGPLATATGAGELICILGPKGGTGKTMTAVNLGVALVELDQRTVIVDLDLQFGDVALTLGLPPTQTIHDLVTAGGTLDAAKIDDYLATHESGLRALLAPTRPDQAGAITVAHLREIYSILRSSFDFVIVDTAPGFTPEVITSIDASTTVVMVGMLDALSLKNTKLGLETLQLMEYQSTDIRLILNRAHTKVGISPDDVTAILGRTPHIYVPSDREIPRALSEGVPIVKLRPNSEPALAFKTLATLLRDDQVASHNDQAEAAEPRRRIFGRKS
ncbi:MAG: CpaE family protein [Gaiellaceae bacterium]